MCTTDSLHNDLGLTDKNHACACGHGATTTDLAVDSAAIHEDYLVTGMTCSHCVSSVTEEVSAIDGVDGVNISLNVGGASRVTVVSAKPVSPDAVRAAVTEAGYALVAD
ncbi:MAG TPA: heavy metal-associated domain-containing protein [Rhodoglobus sp.]|jgi:copper chaperone CopZ|nr:heavy metal-associated domain-containing protein [Rhodoglobus sp.]HOY81522.1 heavy metal-associated domain-containing protein [Rhodoglobus sp.]HPG75652.1 heavy metal-associated domain-containing protein [Rhodoglobus sp.]HPM52207.1 heavy metal-associated domain-containing protein [Rhodoglobus sp.]HQA22820.1 heavy metal-associated domain-containing protein [Rhodoglobus sp.]